MNINIILQGEDKKIELRLDGITDTYCLESKTVKQKEDFASELRKLLIAKRERGNNG